MPSVCKDIAHRYPDIFDLDSVVEKLLPLALLRRRPVPHLAVVHPGTLDVIGRRVLHKLGALCGAKVPHGLNILVLGQVLGQVVTIPGQDVDHAAGQVRRVKNLPGQRKDTVTAG